MFPPVKGVKSVEKGAAFHYDREKTLGEAASQNENHLKKKTFYKRVKFS